MDEEASTSLVAGRTPWTAGLRSIEEQRKKEEVEREQETRRQPQEQERQQEPRELKEQQQQGASRRGSRSSLLLAVHLNRYYWRRKRPGTRKRVCRFLALRPRRGSVPGRPPRSQQSRGGRTVWWRLPA